MLEIEVKEDSAEKLAAVAGKPTKNYLFARELNNIVSWINTKLLRNTADAYELAATPLNPNDKVVVFQSSVPKVANLSEIISNTILVDIFNAPSTSLVETIVASYDVSKMTSQDGIIDIDLRHGKASNGSHQIFIYFSDNQFTFGTKIRTSASVASTNSSVGFRTIFYIKSNIISVNRAAINGAADDYGIGSNIIRTAVVNNASSMKWMHIVLSANVAQNTIYGKIQNIRS